MAGILFIISAPSGSGKSTLVNEVRRLVEGLNFSISYTTRNPRGSEENGREYYFITRDRFRQMIDAGGFLEWAEVFGNFYGTASSELNIAQALGRDLLLDIDVQGALQVLMRTQDAVSLFIVPPSRQVLERRLRNRSQAEGLIQESAIEKRLSQASIELNHLFKYKYVLINDDLNEAAQQLRAIVLTERGVGAEEEQRLAGKCLTTHPSSRLETTLLEFTLQEAQETACG